MVKREIGETLKRRRQQAALSQRQLAQRSGVPQPNISAYESGRRTPVTETLERLDAALRVPTLDRVRAMREPILHAAARRRLSNVRVFGSVASGQESSESDVDLLVDPAPDASIFDLAGFMAEAAELLGVDVDVVSNRGTGPAMDRIRSEAVDI